MSGAGDDGGGLGPGLRWAGGLSVAFLAATFGFIAWFAWDAEQRHRESVCPFRDTGEVRALPEGGEVVERARVCVPGIAEHRFDLHDGGRVVEVGRRRLPIEAWEGHGWSAERVGDDVHVRVTPPEGAAFTLGMR